MCPPSTLSSRGSLLAWVLLADRGDVKPVQSEAEGEEVLGKEGGPWQPAAGLALSWELPCSLSRQWEGDGNPKSFC